MYEGNAINGAVGNYAGAQMAVDASRPRTVGQNIDRRIEQLEKEIESLQAVKAQLATGSILDVDLQNLSMAMRHY